MKSKIKMKKSLSLISSKKNIVGQESRKNIIKKGKKKLNSSPPKSRCKIFDLILIPR